MRITKVDHIGIATRNAQEVAAVYKEFGLAVEATEEVPSQKVRVTFIPVGETRLELLEPTSEDSAVAKFIETRGEGVQHIAFAVEDLDGALAECERAGMRLIDQTPRQGAHHNMIAFIHPKSTKGVLVELCKRRS
jgi:methylmalonyl-CoA epimerase